MLYRFEINLSDVDRGVYETLEFRVAQHPSEVGPYLLSRVLAYALCFQEGIEFTAGGLSDPDSPALRVVDRSGVTTAWIEIGNPPARKLHKATKAAKRVVVFTYKNPDILLGEIQSAGVHRADEIEIFAIDQSFLKGLEEKLEKNNKWGILHHEGRLNLEVGSESLAAEVRRIQI